MIVERCAQYPFYSRNQLYYILSICCQFDRYQHYNQIYVNIDPSFILQNINMLNLNQIFILDENKKCNKYDTQYCNK